MEAEVQLRITEIKDNGGHEHIFVGSVNGEVIGRAALYIDKAKNEAEFRIHLLPEWQNKGYGLELTQVAIKQGLKYLDRIWLGFDEGNERARKIYEKVGFKYFLHRMEILRDGCREQDSPDNGWCWQLGKELDRHLTSTEANNKGI